MPASLNEFFLRLKNIFTRRHMESDMAEELNFHQSLLREKLLRDGVPPAQVDAAARRAFGNSRRWHEHLRELWQFRTLENFLRDLGFAARMLRKSPGFTAVALLTLALGVGANTAVFSLINGLLLRPLPTPNSSQLTVLRYEDGPEPQYDFPTPYFRALENQHTVFANVFAYNNDVLQVQSRSGSENIPGVLVSGQYFQALQTQPLLGRYLTPQDDVDGGSPDGLAVVISESFWQTHFNRSPDVIGSKLIIAHTPFTIVGVMPKRFIGAEPTQRPQIFAPLSADPIIDAPRDHIHANFGAWWLTVVARLQPGVSLDQANAQLRSISMPILHATAPDAEFLADEIRAHFHFSAEPGSGGYTEARATFSKPLLAMFCMCGGILLLACLNLTSLLMARGAARQQELATRLSLGASRARLIQQLLVESLLLALLGAGLGLAAAPLTAHSLAAMLLHSSFSQSIALDTSLDLRVYLFTALIAIVTTLLIGLVPALQATGGQLNAHIKEGQHAAHRQHRRLLPRLLMSFQVALALVLVTGAGLLATSLVRLYNSGAGFNPHNLVNFAFSMDKQPLKGQQLMQLYQQIGDAIAHQPGVQSVTFQFIPQFAGVGWNAPFSAPGIPSHNIMMNSVAPAYFSTMRIPIFQGREFQWSDTSASGLKITLNQSAAKLLFPNQNAVGRTLTRTYDQKSVEVIAVVGDAKYRDMRSAPPPTGYVPIQQDAHPKPSLAAVVRVSDSSSASLIPLAASVRSITARLAPTIPAPVVSTIWENLNNSLSAERLMAILALYFAACALLVTAIGLYGTLAYSTARRTSEIGIRMALGAARAQVVSLIFWENAFTAIIGSAAGLIAAILASRALGSLLYQTSPRDPWVLIISVASLAAIASAASLLPALRATRTNPITAIRCE